MMKTKLNPLADLFIIIVSPFLGMVGYVMVSYAIYFGQDVTKGFTFADAFVNGLTLSMGLFISVLSTVSILMAGFHLLVWLSRPRKKGVR